MLKNHAYSYLSFLLCLFISISVRLTYHQNNEVNGYNATTWDALGYYIYLPATFIYKDIKELDWFPPLDEKYQLSGGTFYQATETEEGNYVFKYLGGVAILQAPFFFTAHLYAQLSDYPPDGFSAPYQYAIIWGAIFWFALGLWVLLLVLRRFYSDRVTALVLFVLVGASNLIQYVSIDGAMSHAFIFPLYSLILWWTIKWHERYAPKYFFLIGLVIGLATISRPTELIMIFIPLLWGVESGKEAKDKMNTLFSNYRLILVGVLGGFIGVFPQLLYWKVASGDWIYNVGSKWYFMNPWWRVIFGFEKGWFIYTPIAVFMVVGLFFLKGKVFRKAVIVFCLLNIWIIMAWSDWRYGASYSTRALTHSYPVYALALGGFISAIMQTSYRFISAGFGIYLLLTNGVQIWQYNAGILHYNDMSRKYYAQIYWNFSPTPLDYSFMDTDFQLRRKHIDAADLITLKELDMNKVYLEPYASLQLVEFATTRLGYLSNHIAINTTKGYNQGALVVREYQQDTVAREQRFRLGLPFYENERVNNYAHHYQIAPETEKVEVSLETFGQMEIEHLTGIVKHYEEVR
jgi:hypothetical protein